MSATMKRWIQIGALALAMLFGATALNPVQVFAQDDAATEAAGAVNSAQEAVDTNDDDDDGDSGRWGLLGLLGLAGLAGLLKRPTRDVVVDDTRGHVNTGTSTRP